MHAHINVYTVYTYTICKSKYICMSEVTQHADSYVETTTSPSLLRPLKVTHTAVVARDKTWRSGG